MNEIAFAVFGTCDGTNGFHSPTTFSLPSPLHRIIDTSLPFLWNKEVFRFYRVITSDKDALYLLSLYQKIDDFGGPRDGAFAGVGIFVRNGAVDSKVLVVVLRDMLSNLISSASNGRQFTSKIQDAAAAGRIRPPEAASQLISSYTKTIINLRPEAGRTGRALISLSDTIIDNPEKFFEINQFYSGIIESNVYYSNDPEFYHSATKGYDLNVISMPEVFRRYEQELESYISDLSRNYRNQIQEERKAKEDILNSRGLMRANSLGELEKLKTKHQEDIQGLNSQLKSALSKLSFTEVAKRELETKNTDLDLKLRNEIRKNIRENTVNYSNPEVEELKSKIIELGKANLQLDYERKKASSENEQLKQNREEVNSINENGLKKLKFSSGTKIKLVSAVLFLICFVIAMFIVFNINSHSSDDGRFSISKPADKSRITKGYSDYQTPAVAVTEPPPPAVAAPAPLQAPVVAVTEPPPPAVATPAPLQAPVTPQKYYYKINKGKQVSMEIILNKFFQDCPSIDKKDAEGLSEAILKMNPKNIGKEDLNAIGSADKDISIYIPLKCNK